MNRNNHKVFTCTKQQLKVQRVDHCTCTLIQSRSIRNADQLGSSPFSVLLLSSSIVSLWRSLFRGIHASAFRPQWPPLYKLSACLPQAFASCFLFFNKLRGVHHLVQWQMQAQNNRRASYSISYLRFFFFFFFFFSNCLCKSRAHVRADTRFFSVHMRPDRG